MLLDETIQVSCLAPGNRGIFITFHGDVIMHEIIPTLMATRFSLTAFLTVVYYDMV